MYAEMMLIPKHEASAAMHGLCSMLASLAWQWTGKDSHQGLILCMHAQTTKCRDAERRGGPNGGGEA